MPAWVRCVNGCFKKVWARQASKGCCPYCGVELPRGLDPVLIVDNKGGK